MIEAAAPVDTAHDGPGTDASLDLRGLPPGTRGLWALGLLATRAPSDAGTPWRLAAWPAPAGTGTPLLWSRDDEVAWLYFGTHHPRTHAADALSPAWVRRVLREPERVGELSGVFAFVAHDRRRDALVVAADRVGVQAVYHARDRAGGWVLSTHLLGLLAAVGHDGGVDETAFREHVGFGYTIDPRTVVYRGVRRLGAASYLRADAAGACEGRYWSPPEVGERTDDRAGARWLDGLAATLDRAGRASVAGAGALVGMTAGKDSLCLAGALAASREPMAGTFGVDGCADRIQGERVSAQLGWPSVSGTVCPAAELERWAVHVAEHSAGLATASYVDMAAFVGGAVPAGRAFVMGEGGECVRDFFLRGDQTPLETLRRDYTTPAEYLRRTLAPPLARELGDVRHELVARARATLDGTGEITGAAFTTRFYRLARMPGNFAPRNAVLGALRPKLSPFLDNAFVDGSFGVGEAWHAGSRLHRELIARTRADLLPYFDAPVRTATTTQEWPARFAGETGRAVAALLEDALPWCADVFDAGGVRALCRETMERPSRALYHLLRVLSFALARRSLRASGPGWREHLTWLSP